jgi:hypothetical protein
MIRLSQLIGQKAIALGTAATTGTVKGVGIEGNRIVCVQLSDSVIPSQAVRSFDGDVLTYDEQAEGGSGNVAAFTLDPRGSRVLDMNGDGFGQIADLAITDTGEIETIVLSTGDSIPGSRLQVIGSYAAVLNVDLPPPTGRPVAGP